MRSIFDVYTEAMWAAAIHRRRSLLFTVSDVVCTAQPFRLNREGRLGVVRYTKRLVATRSVWAAFTDASKADYRSQRQKVIQMTRQELEAKATQEPSRGQERNNEAETM